MGHVLRPSTSWHGQQQIQKRVRPQGQNRFHNSLHPVLTINHVQSEDDDAPRGVFDYGKALMDYLLDMYFSGVFPARTLCIICFYLAHLGVAEAKNFAQGPRSQSGKFQRKVDEALSWNRDGTSKFYNLEAAVRQPRTGEREIDSILFQPPHESLKKEMDEKPELLDNFSARLSTGPWLPIFEEHPQIQRSTPAERLNTLGLALYMDGAAHGKRDELLICTIRFLNSNRRHVCFAFQKSLLCTCGCGGWCTLYPCFTALYWSLVALSQGSYPAAGHNGSELDSHRQSLAGQALGFRSLLLDINGDWAEFAHRFAFPNWNSIFRPCILCDCNAAQLLDPAHVMTEHAGGDYDAACSASEIWVGVLTEEQKSYIKLSLIDDSTRKGLVLKRDCNIVQPRLLKGDRLEPSPSLSDVWSFAYKPVPFTVKFWRIARDKIIAHHRNPIIAADLGISTRNFSPDILHGMHLGVYPAWVTKALWSLFAVDAFQSRTTRSEDHLRHNAICLQTMAGLWYPGYERSLSERGRRGMTRVSTILPGSLGKADLSSLVSFKAAECKHFLPFVLYLVGKYRPLLQAVPTLNLAALEEAGQVLIEWTRLVDASPRLLEPAVARRLQILMDRHVQLAAAADIKQFPKHHWVIVFIKL